LATDPKSKGGAGVLRIDIPGRGELDLRHAVLDFNGTFACDGKILPGVAERLGALARDLAVHILTADTFGTAEQACRGIKAQVVVLRGPLTGPEKASYVEGLGAGCTVAIGNGANDVPMLRRAALGILGWGRRGRRWKPSWRPTWRCARSTTPLTSCCTPNALSPRCGCSPLQPRMTS
jgi:soluble P-type ATPase